MVATTKEEDAALLRIHVMKEKVIAMDQVMGVNMMVMMVVKEILCVEVTIVRSLDITTMRRMTAVRSWIMLWFSASDDYSDSSYYKIKSFNCCIYSFTLIRNKIKTKLIKQSHLAEAFSFNEHNPYWRKGGRGSVG